MRLFYGNHKNINVIYGTLTEVRDINESIQNANLLTKSGGGAKVNTKYSLMLTLNE